MAEEAKFPRRSSVQIRVAARDGALVGSFVGGLPLCSSLGPSPLPSDHNLMRDICLIRGLPERTATVVRSDESGNSPAAIVAGRRAAAPHRLQLQDDNLPHKEIRDESR